MSVDFIAGWAWVCFAELQVLLSLRSPVVSKLYNLEICKSNHGDLQRLNSITECSSCTCRIWLAP
jgi:hypothetical protein